MMTLHEIRQESPPALHQLLHEFEGQFTCSLGGGRTFRFTYPEGYVRYLASLGDSCCVAGEVDGRIVGMIGGAVLQLRLPTGTNRPASFIEEVKLLPDSRRTGRLWPLLARCQEWALSKSEFILSAVLDETPIKPSAYTGRAGLVPLREVARIVVLRIPVAAGAMTALDDCFLVSDSAGRQGHSRLTAGRYAVSSDHPEIRSVLPPTWLVHPRGTACGLLEDRRKVRQVTMDDGTELVPFFLGSFAFSDVHDGAALIFQALRRSAVFGATALRMALPESDFHALSGVTGPRPGILAIPAAIYAHGISGDAPWTLSGLEI